MGLSPELPMSLINTDEFLDLLRRSKIVANEPLEKALDFLRAQGRGELASEAPRLAEQLVELGLITAWQSEKLLARRYRGFFLGRYKLLEQIGSGGMSRVFLAEHQMLHRQRAIKVLPRERVKDSTYLARFQLEARAIATLDHPNIVRAYDIDSVGDIHYLVMEYVRGPDLQRLVQQQGPLDFASAADYVAQAARGLHHAHQAGLIHRDVKPANILIDEHQVVKVLDLGLALFHEIADEASLTIAHDEKVLGTADYLAPEQALDSHSIDHRADQYGLGCTLYFALTGSPPFPDGSIAQRIARHQSRMPPPLHASRANCPAELEAICFRLMQKKPEDRYATAAEVAEVLESFVQHYAADSVQESDTRSPNSAAASECQPVVAPVAMGGSPVPARDSSSRSLGSARSGGSRGSHASDSNSSRPFGSSINSGSSSTPRPRPDDTLADQMADTVKGLPKFTPSRSTTRIPAEVPATSSLSNPVPIMSDPIPKTPSSRRNFRFAVTRWAIPLVVITLGIAAMVAWGLFG